MDIFKFNPSGGELYVFENGEIVNGILSKIWIERYQGFGEFTLEAKASSGVREMLPIGTFISHIDSTEIMVVENHQISESDDSLDPIITITGRSFETELEQRIVGTTLTTAMEEYGLDADYTDNQAVQLINEHIALAFLTDTDDAYDSVLAGSIAVVTGDSVYRPVKRGTVYKALMDILALDDLGVRIERPSAWSVSADLVTKIVVHNGIVRSDEVIFSYFNGEIQNAEYLWSNKKAKSTALVVSKWFQLLVDDSATSGYYRRTMLVEASDVDNAWAEEPTGGDLTSIMEILYTLGVQALSAQSNVALVKVEIPKGASRYQYRRDYNVGDIITVEGNYDTSSLARVVEYVEIDNDQGETGYPTLSLISSDIFYIGAP